MPAYKKKSTKSMKRPPIIIPPSVVLCLHENGSISAADYKQYLLAKDDYMPSVKKP